MSMLYYILSVAGWVWLAAVAIGLPILLAVKRRRAALPGFDVIRPGGTGDSGGGGGRSADPEGRGP